MTTNRSAEELRMRDLVEVWGRARWPGARVVHELVVSDCRIDMAFVARDHLVGVEIKSSRDVMTRLDKQLAAFQAHIPEVWLAYAPRWIEAMSYHDAPHRVPYLVGQIIVGDDDVASMIPFSPTSSGYPHPAFVDRTITAPMLDLLWRDEAFRIAARAGFQPGRRATLTDLRITLARRLTGDEIVREVCRELRNRNAFWKADEPMGEAA